MNNTTSPPPASHVTPARMRECIAQIDTAIERMRTLQNMESGKYDFGYLDGELQAMQREVSDFVQGHPYCLELENEQIQHQHGELAAATVHYYGGMVCALAVAMTRCLELGLGAGGCAETHPA